MGRIARRLPLIRFSTRMSWSFSARAGLAPAPARRARRSGPAAVARQQMTVAALRTLLRRARPHPLAAVRSSRVPRPLPAARPLRRGRPR
ncbi:hypothetical protein [Streptomyces sp. NPDC058739]|uniref:hypothetical protein n=1 Tax=Streptomyces sp. NPDC058739 TaxID=3346618 RepID=UPI00368D9E14